MKKVVKQEPVKLSASDFPLQMDCQVTLEEYQAYALWTSEETRKTVKKRTLISSAILFVAGVIVMFRGMNSTWVYHDWITILGVLAMVYGVLDLFYQFVMFPSVLKKQMAKEFAKDSRLNREMTFCFAEDRMISFYKGAHQGTFFFDEVVKRQENEQLLLLSLKNGKIIVLPKRVIAAAAPEVQKILAGLGKEA